MKRVLTEALSRLQRHRLFKSAASALAGETNGAPPPLPPYLGPALDRLHVLLLGTCGLELLARSADDFRVKVDHLLMESFSHSETPDLAERPRDIAIVALTLRHILGEAAGAPNVGADLLFARVQTLEAAKALCDRCAPLIQAKARQLHAALGGAPMLFTTFVEPSFDYLGALRTKDYGRSPIEIVRRLNTTLRDAVAPLAGAYVLDVNLILNQVGRAHLQDDAVMSATHGSYLHHGVIDIDAQRIMPPKPPSSVYRIEAAERAYATAFWTAVADSVKIIRGAEPVKLLIVDLDDTLWRGVASEDDVEPCERIEGWPIGLMEALLVFKGRGGLLAICSKNDRDATLGRMQEIWQGAVSPEDFAVIKINWSPKSQNVAEILQETNLLPANVAILDDNPREVDEIRARFPDLRVLGFDAYDWRRIILRAPETQTTETTAESLQRTELVQARLERENAAVGVSRADWLTSLHCRQRFEVIRNAASPAFVRTLELLNKTNQFNTTGRRWGAGELADFLQRGGVAVSTALKDRTADNGVIGVALVEAGEIVQLVLSCRVFGLGAETNLGRAATLIALSQAQSARGRILDTGRNFTCHGLFETLGFHRDGDQFVCDAPGAPTPWIEVESWDLV
jgi:FkbH-like protein